MNSFQGKLIIIFAIINFLVFLKGFFETSKNKNAFGVTPWLTLLGIFVWGDAVIIGIFWVAISIVSLLFGSWYLFLSFVSLFWVVRSLGEVIYWISQQFSNIVRNPPQTLFGYSIFKNDSIWFAYQVVWQCILVVSIITSAYFINLWLNLI